MDVTLDGVVVGGGVIQVGVLFMCSMSTAVTTNTVLFNLSSISCGILVWMVSSSSPPDVTTSVGKIASGPTVV